MPHLQECLVENGMGCSLHSDQAADPIMEIITASTKFTILTHAVELGLFDEIEAMNEPATAAAIAKRCGFDRDITERLLNVLTCYMLLKKEVNDNGVSLYRNSSGTSKYLTRARNTSLISVVMMQQSFILPMLEKLPHLIKTGRLPMNIQKEMNGNDVKDATNISKTAKLNDAKLPTIVNDSKKPGFSPKIQNKNLSKMPPGSDKLPSDFQSKFIAVMDSLAAPSAPALVKAFDLGSHRVAVDLGGGSGRISAELVKVYPDMKVTLFDLPPVVQMAQKMNAHQKSPVIYTGGDFFKDDLPSADLYILAHVVHGWDIEHIDILLKKVYKKLSPGGSILIMEKVLTQSKDGPDLAITNDLAISLMTKGRERTGAEYDSLLSRHGFKNVLVRNIEGYNYYDAVMAKKPF